MNGEKKEWKPGGKPDEHHGMGGTYEVVDGKRVLVPGSRTDMNPRVRVNPATGERTLIEDDAAPVVDPKE